MVSAVLNDLINLCFFFFYLFYLIRKFRHGNRRKLNIEFLQQFALIAHGCPEIIRSGGYLQNADAPECLYYITDCQEIPDSTLKYRILQSAVRQIREGYLKSAEYLTCSKQSALGVTESCSVRLRSFIQRSPQQHGYLQFLCQTSAFILCSEIAVGKKQPVYLFLFKLLRNFNSVCLVIQQSFFIDIGDINKINSQAFQFFRCQSSVFHCIRSAENTSSCRRKSKLYVFHLDLHQSYRYFLFLRSLYFLSYLIYIYSLVILSK